MRQIEYAGLTWLIGIVLAVFPSYERGFADEAVPKLARNTIHAPPNLAGRIQEITDTVLANHVDPPARQQMILDGVKAMYRTAGQSIPAGLARRVSSLTTTEQLQTFLADIWPKSTTKPVAPKALESSLVEGLLAHVRGGARLISAKERAVEEQFEGNRYVGIHIHLGRNAQEKRPSVPQVIEGGPASRAGVKKDDLLMAIDGVDTTGMTLEEVADRLRGQEGTNVIIKVREPNTTVLRTYTITRGQHAQSTIQGAHKRPDGDWDCMLDESTPIAYLRIQQISASTPHDLRKLARQVEMRGQCGIILDLRGIGGTSVHPAVLLADTLLTGGIIGRLRTADRELTYQADPDAIFRGLPIAVLVDQSTSGTVEWLAAALQDNRRAMIVGSPTFSTNSSIQKGVSFDSDVRSKVSAGNGSWSIELMTGYLLRGDGRRLSAETKAIQSPFIRPRNPTDANESSTGVKPDHVIVLPIRRPGQTRVQSNDAVMREAIRLLQQALDKFS